MKNLLSISCATLVLGLIIAPGQALADKVVRLTKLTVDETTEGGSDEVYINLLVDGVSKRIPASGERDMNEDSDTDTWFINAEFRISDYLSLNVKEDDSSSDDDTIGNIGLSLTGSAKIGFATFKLPVKADGSYSQRLTGDGADYTLYYTVEEVGSLATNGFTMVIMSDPQYGYCESDHCKTVLKSSERANELHVKSIKAVQAAATNFSGVIINGDLTNTEDDHQLEAFRRDYEANFTIFPGLGNHDYQNYYKKSCADVGIAIAKYYCTKEMLDYIQTHVETSPIVTGFDFDSGKWNRDGSYSYYFDIGDYRFVQLHNHPAYAVSFAVYMSNRVGSEDYNVTTSLDWLRGVLANSGSKTVILNMHGLHAKDTFDDSNPTYAAEYEKFQRILGDYPNVAAVFAGHIHKWAGQLNFGTTKLQNGTILPALPQGRSNVPGNIEAKNSAGGFVRWVPAFFGGGAEYSKYTEVFFEQNRFSVQIIDSRNGTADKVGTPVVVTH